MKNMKLKLILGVITLLSWVNAHAQSPVYSTVVNVRDSVKSLNVNTDLKLYGNGTGKVSIEGNYTLPSSGGTDGQALISDGAGGVAFEDIPTSASGIVVDDTNFIVLDGIDAQTVLESVDDEVLTARTTGIEYGGLLSINGGDPSKFDVTAGKADILDNTDPVNPVYTNVSWTAKTAVTPANVGVNYLYFDDNTDVLKQTLTAPTREDRRTRVWVGRVIYDGVNVQGLANDRDFTRQLAPQLRDVSEALGLVKLNGLVISANGANLSVDRSAGDLFDFGANGQESPHTKTFALETAFDFFYLTQAAEVGSSRTTVDPDNYDNAGTITAVSSNKYTIQNVYLFSSGNIRLQYGQAEYNSLSDAISAIGNRAYNVNPNTTLGLLLGWVVVKEGTVSLQNASNARITQANRFGGIGGGISAQAGALIAANNLADLDNVVTARDNLGVEIGVDVQAYDTELATIAGLANASGALTNDGAGNFSYNSSVGDVTKVGTPLNNQVTIWTGDGTVEGDPSFTFDGTFAHLGAGDAVTSIMSEASSTMVIQPSVSGYSGTMELRGDAQSTAAKILVYGNNHATFPGEIRVFGNSGSNTMSITSSGLDMSGKDITEVSDITRTGTLDIDGTTGVTASYNGTVELSVESNLVEVQNDLKVLGAVNNDVGSYAATSTDPEITDIISVANLTGTAVYFCSVHHANGTNNQTVLITTDGSKILTINEIFNSGSSILTWVDNSGALAIQKTTAATPGIRYTILKMR